MLSIILLNLLWPLSLSLLYLPSKKFFSDLRKIRQSEGESLKSFISRFNFEAIQVEDLNHKITYEALKGTKNIKFMNSLIKNSVATYQIVNGKSQKMHKF